MTPPLSEQVTRDCDRCEGGGNYSEMAVCTTLDAACDCHHRVLVDPCPDCQGFGQFTTCPICKGRGCWDCNDGMVPGP